MSQVFVVVAASAAAAAARDQVPQVTSGMVARWEAWRTARGCEAATAKRWRQASTVAELGELTAVWLEGGLAFHPGGYDVPDPETHHLVPVLAGLNRAGFLTEVSQPGLVEEVDGVQWRQRAAVQGFVADEQVVRSLVDAARVHGLVCFVNTREGRRRDREAPVVVTTGGGSPYTEFGGWLSRGTVRLTYGAVCRREAVAAVCSAVQVTVVDPVWCRDDVLWPVLAGALATPVTGTAVTDPAVWT